MITRENDRYQELELQLLETEDIAQVKHRMYPVANLKGVAS